MKEMRGAGQAALLAKQLPDDHNTQPHPSIHSPHLEAVPGVGTLTTRRLAGGDAQGLGGQADGALHLQLLVLGALHKVSRHYTKNNKAEDTAGIRPWHAPCRHVARRLLLLCCCSARVYLRPDPQRSRAITCMRQP